MKAANHLVNRSSQRLVAIAEVARPHGIQGELRLKLYNPESDILGRGRRVFVQLPGEAEPVILRIEAARPALAPGGVRALLVRLEGVEDRDAAGAMRGAVILVDRAELPETEDGEFYAVDIEGASAELAGAAIGVVERLVSYPTCDVLVIRGVDGKRLEVPLTDAFVEVFDAEARVVRLKTVDGIDA